MPNFQHGDFESTTATEIIKILKLWLIYFVSSIFVQNQMAFWSEARNFKIKVLSNFIKHIIKRPN